MSSRQPSPSRRVAGQPTGQSAEIRVLPGATGTAWQAILANALDAYDRVLVVGAEGEARAWAEIALAAGLRVEMLEEPGPKSIARRIGADRFGLIKAVLVVAGEADPKVVRAALDAAFHDALLFVDASAAPGADLTGAEADVILTDPRTGLAALLLSPPMSLSAE